MCITNAREPRPDKMSGEQLQEMASEAIAGRNMLGWALLAAVFIVIGLATWWGCR